MKSWIGIGFFFLLTLINEQSLYAAIPAVSTQSPKLTGSLIAPKGTVVPYGEFVIESYLYWTTRTGSYDAAGNVAVADHRFYSLNSQFLCFFGLTPWCDLNIIPQLFYNTTFHQHCVRAGDLTIGLDFQLMRADFTPYFPGIKLSVREVFPTGDFQNLRPVKLETDLTGAGTFATQFDLVLYKEFSLWNHLLSTTLSTQYTVTTPVRVHGFNAYGCGFGANGIALAPQSFQGILGLEFALDHHWALALDHVYTYTEAAPFFGIPGISFSGTFADTGKPSSEVFSIAPAIEYRFKEHLGIIAGCWFTVFGRNTPQFFSSVINFEYTY